MPHDPQDALSKPWVQELLSQAVLARLGTANPQTAQPHVTPVWFKWDGECLYISAFISTRKAREVTRNQRISVLIDVEKPTRAVVLEGIAEVLSDPAQVAPLSEAVYACYVGPEAVKSDPYQSWVHDAENRVIRLKPEKVFAWEWE
jgi:PPOX class probable F420-dependent enzyme